MDCIRNGRLERAENPFNLEGRGRVSSSFRKSENAREGEGGGVPPLSQKKL
jgi:hypothetical protein